MKSSFSLIGGREYSAKAVCTYLVPGSLVGDRTQGIKTSIHQVKVNQLDKNNNPQ